MAKKKERQHHKTHFSKINSFLEDERVKKITGLFFLVTATFLVVSFVSYLLMEE